MDKKLITVLSVLGLLVVIFFINTTIQKGYNSKENILFSIDKNNINKIIIKSNVDAIELTKTDSTWIISGNDTLMIKENVINNFFDTMYNLKKKHLVTSREEKWINYGINNEEGTHLAMINSTGETIAYYVFGKSKDPNEYNTCYVRSNQSLDVFLLDNNITYQLQTNPTYWGQIPQNEELQKDLPITIE